MLLARAIPAPSAQLSSGPGNSRLRCGRPAARPLLTAGAFGKGGGDKEEAARKALQDAFKGKKDPFAAAEERAKRRGGGGGGGGGDGGGGGGGGGFGGFDFGEWWDGFKRSMSSLMKTIGTVLLLVGAIAALSLWQPLLALANRVVRAVLRLDGNPRAQMARQKDVPQADLTKTDGLGNVEQAVIDKYAAADDEDGSEGDE